MTDSEAELLNELRAATYPTPDDPKRWDRGCRPMDLGGYNGSNHSNRLKRLCDKGWAERSFGCGWGRGPCAHTARGSCRYRVTQDGVNALLNHQGQREAARRILAGEPL